MDDGNLQKEKLRYTGTDVDIVLDRLPTACIFDETDGHISFRQRYLARKLICSRGVRVKMLKYCRWRVSIHEKYIYKIRSI